ncbi:MAG TPA: CBS domain-containing protein [Fimbriimonas sp.]|nr:CBS domain-containing protein [Fimbriimonas sp.]
MKISEVISLKPISVSPNLTVGDTARVMERCGCAFLPVVSGGKVYGAITDRDLAIGATGHGLAPEVVRVSAIMSHPPICISGESELEAAAKLMLEKNVRRLIVVDAGGQFLGVLSVIDLAGQLSDNDLSNTIHQFAMQNHPDPSHPQHNGPLPEIYIG